MVCPAFFTQRSSTTFDPTPLAISYWSKKSIGGPATCAILARQLEKLHGGADVQPARLTIDMFKPVPAGSLTVATTEVRTGNRIRVADADLIADGQVVARASCTFLKRSTQPKGSVWQRSSHPQPPPKELAAELDQHGVPLFGSGGDPHSWSMDMGRHQGHARKRMWTRSVGAVVGETPTPFVVAAVVGEATSLVTNWGTEGLGFINCDLTLTLARMPVGTEMGIEADNHISVAGVAVCAAVLYDRDGQLGTCVVTALSNAERQLDLAASR